MSNDWEAYQLDCAVSLFGSLIENALFQRVELEDGQSRPRYTLRHLLTAGTIIDVEEDESDDDWQDVDGILT